MYAYVHNQLEQTSLASVYTYAQLGTFALTASLTSHLRQLLQKDTLWAWLPEHKIDFVNTKKALTSPTMLQPFDPNCPTDGCFPPPAQHRLCSGPNLQRSPGPHTMRIHFPVGNTITVKLKCLAIVNAITKCSYYLSRWNTTFDIRHTYGQTDHRPLVGAFDFSHIKLPCE